MSLKKNLNIGAENEICGSFRYTTIQKNSFLKKEILKFSIDALN